MQKQLLHQVCNVRKVSKFLLTLGTFYFMNFSLTLASTTVPGGNISGHWTLAGSPYNIMGNVTIPSGATLTIDPGVSVVFQTSNDLRMMVNGCILAVGTPSQYIYFTAADQGSGFGGFRFDSLASTNDSSKFIYCNIQYGMDNPCPFCSGGAFYFSSWSKAVISHSTIANCQANNGYGGAIFCSASSPVITYDSLYNNSTQNYGGAIYIQNDTGEIISYNVISNNTSSSGGGAIFMNQPIKAVINYNNISFNTATTEAGGIGCNGGTFSSMNNNAIYFNTVSNGSAGGGIYLYSVNITSLNHNTITYNSLPNAYGGGGGGIWAEGCVFNSIDYDNISYNSLGADSYGGGIELYQCDVSSFSYDTISNNNVGTNGSGGGIYVYSSFSESINTTVSNTSITNNTADLTDGQGGGFYCQSANPTFLNVTMSGNNAYQGGALFFYQAKPSLYNSILWGDSAVTDTGGNEMYQYDPSCVISFYYCDVYGDSNAFGIPTGVKYTGTYKNNIHSDPKFDSTSGGVGYMNDGMLVNWGIKNTSPCFNTGDPSYLPGYPALDLAGNTRVTVCRIDMGAFENQYAQPLKLTVSTVNTVCGALATGEAAVQVVGGSTPFTYSWSGGQTTDTIKAQKAGSYTVTVKEGSGCTDKITATIIANTSMTATFSQTPPLCNGGSDGKASAMVSNGAKPYTYLWSPSGETSDTATGLSGITYTCTIMDSNGCQITPTVTISQPAAITVTNSWTDASCSNNDGIAGVTPSGGTPPYTYLCQQEAPIPMQPVWLPEPILLRLPIKIFAH
ncbi:MAG: choice-of-anchor Q domain-containing protein [Bacteroidia bacterium]